MCYLSWFSLIHYSLALFGLALRLLELFFVFLSLCRHYCLCCYCSLVCRYYALIFTRALFGLALRLVELIFVIFVLLFVFCFLVFFCCYYCVSLDASRVLTEQNALRARKTFLLHGHSSFLCCCCLPCVVYHCVVYFCVSLNASCVLTELHVMFLFVSKETLSVFFFLQSLFRRKKREKMPPCHIPFFINSLSESFLVCPSSRNERFDMGWLRLVGSLKS